MLYSCMINELKLHLTNLIKDYTKRKYLLAVSGGVDSVVLAQLFFELDLDFAVAHCNFQLRGVDADADERFVSILSNRWQKPFFIKRFETESYVNSHKVSIQMAARTLRYEWFEELRHDKGFDYIVTAHHKNDLAETILLNLAKGTGHAGLVGIRPLQGSLLRPLLPFEKTEIEKLALQKDLTWREDSSNSLDKYQRNHLRLNVIPLLKVVNPKVEEALARTSAKMLSAQNFIQNQVQKIAQQVVTNTSNTLEISYNILKEGEDAAFILSEILRPYNFDIHKCEQILSTDLSEPGASFMSETHHLVTDRNKFVISALRHEQTTELELEGIPEHFAFGDYTFETSKVKFDPQLTLSKDDLLVPENWMHQKLTLRYPLPGDSIAPYGMNGRNKKVADLLNEAKIPLNLKNYIPIFQIEQEIIWVVGVRSSHVCKVENGENTILIKASKA